MNEAEPAKTISSELEEVGRMHHKDLRWIIGGVFSAIGLIIALGFPMLMKIGSMETSIVSLNETMKEVVLRDMADIKRRIIMMEERGHPDHEHRLRELERSMITLQKDLEDFEEHLPPAGN